MVKNYGVPIFRVIIVWRSVITRKIHENSIQTLIFLSHFDTIEYNGHRTNALLSVQAGLCYSNMSQRHFSV